MRCHHNCTCCTCYLLDSTSLDEAEEASLLLPPSSSFESMAPSFDGAESSLAVEALAAPPNADMSKGGTDHETAGIGEAFGAGLAADPAPASPLLTDTVSASFSSPLCFFSFLCFFFFLLWRW